MVAFIALIAGFGLTVTVTVNDDPVQLPDTGITVYVAVRTVLVVLVSVPEISVAPLPVAPPVKPVPAGAAQLYVMPEGTVPSVIFTGVTVNVPPLHIAATNGFIAGLGLTVTVTVNDAPGQLPNNAEVVGVTVYVAVWAVLVLFV